MIPPSAQGLGLGPKLWTALTQGLDCARSARLVCKAAARPPVPVGRGIAGLWPLRQIINTLILCGRSIRSLSSSDARVELCVTCLCGTAAGLGGALAGSCVTSQPFCGADASVWSQLAEQHPASALGHVQRGELMKPAGAGFQRRAAAAAGVPDVLRRQGLGLQGLGLQDAPPGAAPARKVSANEVAAWRSQSLPVGTNWNPDWPTGGPVGEGLRSRSDRRDGLAWRPAGGSAGAAPPGALPFHEAGPLEESAHIHGGGMSRELSLEALQAAMAGVDGPLLVSDWLSGLLRYRASTHRPPQL